MPQQSVKEDTYKCPQLKPEQQKQQKLSFQIQDGGPRADPARRIILEKYFTSKLGLQIPAQMSPSF